VAQVGWSTFRPVVGRQFLGPALGLVTTMRNIFHVVISLLMWCLFGYYWFVVSKREIGAETLQALVVLSIVILVGLIVTFWWVKHNKKLALRNRRNTPPPPVPEPFESDTLNRPIIAPSINELQAASIIDIELVPYTEEEKAADPDNEYPGKKVYSVVRGRR